MYGKTGGKYDKLNYEPLFKDAVMETETKSEFNPRTMLNKDGNYPKWMNKNKIKKIKKTNSEKKKGTKKKHQL